MMNKNKTVVVSIVCILAFLSVPTVEAQLFKGKQRRAARQSGGSAAQSGGGGLFGNKQSRQQQSVQPPASQPKQKTGLFGKPKESKSGGLFKRNKKVSESGAVVEKRGLFGNGKARREQQAQNAYSSSRHQPRQFSQQQFNQQATVNSVQRSQRASTSQSLFRPDSSPAVAASSSSAAVTEKRPAGSQPSTSPNSARLDEALKVVDRPRLPQISRDSKAQRERSREAPPQALVRSRPSSLQKTQHVSQQRSPSQLRNSSKSLANESPTGIIPTPPKFEGVQLKTLA